LSTPVDAVSSKIRHLSHIVLVNGGYVKGKYLLGQKETMKERTPLNRGERKKVTIQSLAPEGAGVSKDFGLPIFVEKVAVGDEALVEISEAKSNFARATLVEILTPSPDRIEPPCHLFDRCGGCQWQHLSYPAQLQAKADIIKQSFRHIAGLATDLTTDVMQPTIGAFEQFHYRNKVHFLAAPPGQGSAIKQQAKSTDNLELGYYEGASHNLVNIEHCPVQPATFDAVINLVRQLCRKHGILPYDGQKGLLRSVSVRHSQATGEILVTFVVHCDRHNLPKRIKEIAKEMVAQIPQIKGVCVNFHTKPDSRLYGDETMCISGQEYIVETIKSKEANCPERLSKGLVFQLSSTSFFQINSEQALTMLECIRKIVESFLKEKALAAQKVTLLDAYAGVGAIAFWLASSVNKVVAIEENLDAVADAELNLELNEIANVDIYPGKVEDALPELIKRGLRPQIVVIDPPRKGCTKEVLQAIIELAPELIIYVSCNPVTLARDLKIILSPNHQSMEGHRNHEDFGYKTKQILPIDLFPQTYHIESITVLERQFIHDEDGHMEEARAR